MKLFIIIIMTIFAPLHAFAKNAGSLYFPVAWEIQTNAEPQENQFSSATIVFKNTTTGKTVSFPFEQSTILDLSSENTRNALTFFGKKTFELPSGHYDTISFSAKYLNRSSIVYDYHLMFDIVDEKLTILSGVLARSKFDEKTQKTNSKPVVLTNRTSMDYNEIVKMPSVGGVKEGINFLNTTSPLITQELMSGQNGSSARYGFIIQLPCGFNGNVLFNFKPKNDPVSYYKKIAISPQYCHANSSPQQNTVNIFLPKGEWKIVQISQVHKRAAQTLEFAAINHPKLLAYYNTNAEKFLRNNAYSKKISKPFVIPVNAQSFSRSFFYAGIFAATINPDTNDFSSLTFQRNFSLRKLRQIFGARQAFNAYNGQRIMHDKILGDVGVLLSNVHINQGFDPQLTNVGNNSVNIISGCLKSAELQNPLLSIDGKILLTNQTGTLSVTKENLNFIERSQSVDEISNCVINGFTSTQISTPKIQLQTPAEPSKSKEQLVLEAKIYSL